VALIGWFLLLVVSRMWLKPGLGWLRWLGVTLVVSYFSIATPLGANLLVGALERENQVSSDCLEPAPDAVIVVLAGGKSGRPASANDVSKLTAASLKRVIGGVELANRSRNSLLVLSGGAGDAVREADLMSALAVSLGFPRGRLLTERDSQTTAEATRNVTRLLADVRNSATSVHLVTSAIHMPRAVASFRKQGLSVCPVPVDRRWVRPRWNEALIPQISALQKSTEALHEIGGYVAYGLTGEL